MHATGSRKIRTALLAMMTLGAAFSVHSQMRQGEVDLVEDLRTVIILAGYQCKRISAHSQSGPFDHHVTCDVGSRYRVRISEEEQLLVESESSPATDSLPGGTAHDEFMKRQLFAIVNLAGHDCKHVLGYESAGPMGHTVICEDQTVFRIHVTPAGRVAVERQRIEK